MSDDDALIPVEETPYDSEDLLQRLLADHPVLLPDTLALDQEPRRWLLVRRELGVAFEGTGGTRWSVDHLFLDQDAVPTLVEVKRSTDTRVRREVVGQMLDYAASAPFLAAAQIRVQFESDCERRSVVPAAEIARLVQVDDVDIEAYWANVDANLRNSRIRLLFVTDLVPPELRRIVEFLNAQMATVDVLAVEIRQFAGAAVRALVPTVVGATAAAQAVKQPTARVARRIAYTRQEWLEKLAENVPPAAVAAFTRIADWCYEQGAEEVFGSGPTDASYSPVWTRTGARRSWPFRAYSKGYVETPFASLVDQPPFDDVSVRQELLAYFNRIDGVRLPPDAIDRRLSFRADVLADRAAEDALRNLLHWFLQQIQPDVVMPASRGQSPS